VCERDRSVRVLFDPISRTLGYAWPRPAPFYIKLGQRVRPSGRSHRPDRSDGVHDNHSVIVTCREGVLASERGLGNQLPHPAHLSVCMTASRSFSVTPRTRGEKPHEPVRVMLGDSIWVGDVVLENVTASVAPSQGSLLLGQSFLSRFKSWSIDNAIHELLLEAQ
jgi:hypothetical protein